MEKKEEINERNLESIRKSPQLPQVQKRNAARMGEIIGVILNMKSLLGLATRG